MDSPRTVDTVWNISKIEPIWRMGSQPLFLNHGFEELLLITVPIRAKPEEEGGYLAIIPRVALV